MDPNNYLWFHGRVTRQEAEDLLERAGKKDGMFLLRESTAQTGSYAVSMCHNRKVIHYHIQRHPDGKVAIEDGPKFDGPVELIQYHHHNLDGLLAKLAVPCNRLPNVPPKKYSGANQSHIQDAACAALATMGLVVSRWCRVLVLCCLQWLSVNSTNQTVVPLNLSPFNNGFHKHLYLLIKWQLQYVAAPKSLFAIPMGFEGYCV